MLKRILFIVLLAVAGQAKSYIFSPIPSVTNEILDVDPNPCNAFCQESLLQDGLAFSFLAKYDKLNNNDSLKNAYQELKSILNLEDYEQIQTQKIKIAVLVPSMVIGRYASTVVDAINSFLLSKNIDFYLKVYDSKREDPAALQEQLSKIAQDGFSYIVAPLTANGADAIARLTLPFTVYIPTVNKNDVDRIGSNIVYGGIDYKEQIRVIEKYINSDKVVIIDEPISLSKKISSYYIEETRFTNPVLKTLTSSRVNFRETLRDLGIDENTTLFLNTRPILTSLILSQLTYNGVNVSKVISTQLNFTSLVLRLAQAKDLANFFVASSISDLNDKLYEANKLFNNDIAFDWVVYSSTVMTDIILQRSKRDFSSRSKTFNIEMFNNSLIYKTKIYKVHSKRFVKIGEE